MSKSECLEGQCVWHGVMYIVPVHNIGTPPQHIHTCPTILYSLSEVLIWSSESQDKVRAEQGNR